MHTIQEMNNWNYSKTWRFFTENAVNQYIPEAELYLRSLKICETVDIRDDKEARNKILDSIKCRTLVFIDGASANGKTTFAKRLASHTNAEVVDIDIICKEWIDKQLKDKDILNQRIFISKADELTDKFVLENLERIVLKKSRKNKTVILVGVYLEAVYRSIIAKTLGKYFDQVVSIYCCSKSFKDIKMMLQKREAEFGKIPGEQEKIFQEYMYSKRLLESNGIMLGIGMNRSFIADIAVSDMFV